MNSPKQGDNNEGYETVARLERAFADGSAQLERSYRTSEDFREICNDYCECDVILEKFRSGSAMSDREVADYERMQSRLADEIRDWLRNQGI